MGDKQEDEFTRAIERFVHYKVSNFSDAEDILQDKLSSAFTGFEKLSDKLYFKKWIIGIASHKCVDYYKKKAKVLLKFRLTAFLKEVMVCTVIKLAALFKIRLICSLIKIIRYFICFTLKISIKKTFPCVSVFR